MITKNRLSSVLLGLFGLFGSAQCLLADQPSISELSNLQQQSLMLKVALEHAKLQKELLAMNDVKGVSGDICNQKGVGSLSLNAVYGVKKQRFATFSYNNATQMDAKVGDTLLCSEKVKHISLEKVEVEKEGKRYVVAGTVTAIPSVPLQTISPTMFH